MLVMGHREQKKTLIKYIQKKQKTLEQDKILKEEKWHTNWDRIKRETKII